MKCKFNVAHIKTRLAAKSQFFKIDSPLLFLLSLAITRLLDAKLKYRQTAFVSHVCESPLFWPVLVQEWTYTSGVESKPGQVK